MFFFFFQAEDGIRDKLVTGVQTCALPISAGALLVSTDAALAGVDIDRGQVLWEKADLGGLPTDSVRLVEGSLLVDAARPGLLVILDPGPRAVLFDSRAPGLTQLVTPPVLPQSGTLLVEGRRGTRARVVAVY